MVAVLSAWMTIPGPGQVFDMVDPDPVPHLERAFRGQDHPTSIRFDILNRARIVCTIKDKDTLRRSMALAASIGSSKVTVNSRYLATAESIIGGFVSVMTVSFAFELHTR